MRKRQIASVACAFFYSIDCLRFFAVAKDVNIETKETDSFNIPEYEPTKISYTIKAAHTGTVSIFVITGFFIQSEIVTSVDAHIGKRLKADFQVSKERVQLIPIKTKSHTGDFFSFINTVSLKIPVIFGIAPAHAERHK